MQIHFLNPLFTVSLLCLYERKILALPIYLTEVLVPEWINLQVTIQKENLCVSFKKVIDQWCNKTVCKLDGFYFFAFNKVDDLNFQLTDD